MHRSRGDRRAHSPGCPLRTLRRSGAPRPAGTARWRGRRCRVETRPELDRPRARAQGEGAAVQHVARTPLTCVFVAPTVDAHRWTKTTHRPRRAGTDDGLRHRTRQQGEFSDSDRRSATSRVAKLDAQTRGAQRRERGEVAELHGARALSRPNDGEGRRDTGGCGRSGEDPADGLGFPKSTVMVGFLSRGSAIHDVDVEPSYAIRADTPGSCASEEDARNTTPLGGSSSWAVAGWDRATTAPSNVIAVERGSVTRRSIPLHSSATRARSNSQSGPSSVGMQARVSGCAEKRSVASAAKEVAGHGQASCDRQLLVRRAPPGPRRDGDHQDPRGRPRSASASTVPSPCRRRAEP